MITLLQKIKTYKINKFHIRKFSNLSNNIECFKNEKLHEFIHNTYKLNNLNYKNLKVIKNYDEYFNLIIKNEYFKNYEELLELKEKNINYNEKNIIKDEIKRNEEKINGNQYKNKIVSNDLQVLFFGSYDNNNSLVLFEKFKSIIEKNEKLQFYFIDVNMCPQCSYNCQITFVPTIFLIYKNYIYRKKIELNYDKSVDDDYLNEFMKTVQQNIDIFHSYNNKFIYSLEKQSNYLNTKYIDIDNQNIHKENWNTY